MNASDRIWDETADVVIVGSGFAGLAAGYEASLRAEKVVILEKMPYSGGNSRIAAGGYAAWTSSLKLRETLGLGEDSRELHIQDTLKAGEGYNDPKLVEVLATEAPDGIDFLLDAGIRFKNAMHRVGGHSACRSYLIDSSGDETIRKLEEHCLSLGKATLRKNSKVTALIRDCDQAGCATGPVLGVSVCDSSGNEYTIRALKGVIIASGGFGNDIALRTAYKPELSEAYNTTNHKGATGEMIRLAEAIGADTVNMPFFQLFPWANPANGSLDRAALSCNSGPSYGMIFVDQTGARFVNELDTREAVAGVQVTSLSKPTYAISNDAVFRQGGVDEKTVASMVAAGRALTAPTLEDLAAEVGFDAATLLDAVAQHNEAIKTGYDARFGEPIIPTMVPMESGPYYAIPQWPSVHFCMGGLRTDEHARVIDVSGATIPNLYAAGEVCGSLHGASRLGGNAIAECIVFGRRAGQLYGSTPLD